MFRKLKMLFLGLVLLTGMSPQLPAQNVGAAYPGNPTIPFIGIPRKTGRIWYVDGTLGNDGFTGNNPFEALKTINKALTRAGTNRGDVIFIYSGTYAENLVITLDNVSLICATITGNSKRCAVAPVSGIPLDVRNVNRFTTYGIRFAGTGAVAAQSSGEGGLFVDCDFSSTTTHGFLFHSDTATAFTGSGTILDNDIFRENGGDGIRVNTGTGVSLGLQATNVRVTNSEFYLNAGNDIGDNAASSNATTFSQWRIYNNYFMTKNKTGGVFYLNMTGTGSTETAIYGNYFSADDLSSTQIKITAGMEFVGNYAFGNGIVTELTP